MNKPSIPIIELKVEGMNCTNCALGIRKALEKDGFQQVEVDFTSDSVQFASDGDADTQRAMHKIRQLGYKARFKNEDHVVTGFLGFSAVELKFWVTAIFTIPLVLAMFIPVDLLHNDIFQLVLTIPVFTIGFFHFGKSAFHSLRSGVTNMDVLIFLGSTAAFVYSLIGTIYGLGHQYMFYETAASIISIVLLGNMLEHRSVKKTTSAIDELTRLQKTIARKIVATSQEGETIEEVDATSVQKGEIVLVNTGDKVPVDGEILTGSARIDESMISGESVPVDKIVGDKVIGGTILESGSIRVKTTAIGKETVLSQIIEMVRNAQKDKPRLQNLADRISAVFVPMVVGIAVLTLAGWYWGAGIEFRDALMRGIAVLVIACPCALGLAIPTAVVVGLGRTAKNGILIKGGSTFDKFTGIQKVVFDKTGTLTTGRFRIKRIETFGESESVVKSILFSIEKHSSHPIARSIVQEIGGVSSIDLVKTEEEKGMGLRAVDTQGDVYTLGSYETVKHLTPHHTHNIYLSRNDKLLAWVDIEDELKPEALQTIQYLQNKGIDPVLLSGDREARCKDIADSLGITEVYAEMLPHQKLEIIEQLSATYKVAMVGDGINDAPALARAHVGISMSDATQVAVKSAEVVLLKGRLGLLPRAFGLAQLTQRTIKENLFWAFFYNVMAIPLAVAGLLSPMVAAGAMALSDIIVVLNSLRLKRRKLP